MVVSVRWQKNASLRLEKWFSPQLVGATSFVLLTLQCGARHLTMGSARFRKRMWAHHGQKPCGKNFSSLCRTMRVVCYSLKCLLTGMQTITMGDASRISCNSFSIWLKSTNLIFVFYFSPLKIVFGLKFVRVWRFWHRQSTEPVKWTVWHNQTIDTAIFIWLLLLLCLDNHQITIKYICGILKKIFNNSLFLQVWNLRHRPAKMIRAGKFVSVPFNTHISKPLLKHVSIDTPGFFLLFTRLLQERQMTYKCLDENDYDKDKCIAFIRNGKYCKKFWVNIRLIPFKQIQEDWSLNRITWIFILFNIFYKASCPDWSPSEGYQTWNANGWGTRTNSSRNDEKLPKTHHPYK